MAVKKTTINSCQQDCFLSKTGIVDSDEPWDDYSSFDRITSALISFARVDYFKLLTGVKELLNFETNAWYQHSAPRTSGLLEMSAYNILACILECPRCGTSAEQTVEVRYGYCDLIQYNLGEEIEWRPGRSVKNGGRPEGNPVGIEGYCECVICGKDFWVEITINDNVIDSVRIDRNKRGYIS